MSNGSLRRAIFDGRAAMYFVFDDRVERECGGGISRGDRKQRLWLRYMPGGMPVQQGRAGDKFTGLRTTGISGWRELIEAATGVAGEHGRGRIPGEVSRERDKADEVAGIGEERMHRVGERKVGTRVSRTNADSGFVGGIDGIIGNCDRGICPM